MQVPLKKISYKLILILITTNWTNNYVQLTQLTFCSCWETQEKWKKNGSCWLKNSFDFIIIYICYMFAAPKRIKNEALVIMMSQHSLHNWRCFHDNMLVGDDVVCRLRESAVDRALGSRWPTVCNAGLAVDRHGADVLFFLGGGGGGTLLHIHSSVHTFWQGRMPKASLAKIKFRLNTVLTKTLFSRRWPNIKTTM